MCISIRTTLYLTFLALAAQLVSAQTTAFPSVGGMEAGAQMRGRYAMTPNVVYLTANSYESKLDVYARIDTKAPMPTLIFIHGGGWTGLNKEYAVTAFMPWLMMGWNVVNVEYRMGKVAPAPAAVVDCLCALRWTAENATMYHIDLGRLVVAGESAGGHLALTTGMIPEAAGLDRQCPGVKLPRVAAIVDWFGPTDLNAMIQGDHPDANVVRWLAGEPNREDLARRISPVTYVRSGLPPIFIVHGDRDPIVPYQQSVGLHVALDKASVPNILYTVQGGEHGHFSPDELIKLYAALTRFLESHAVPLSP